MRFLAIFLGMALLFWFPIEDTAVTWATLFAMSISGWLAIAFLIKKPLSLRSLLYNHILTGFLAGILITPIALLLIVFKTGFHAHEAPDYTIDQLISIVWKTPIWVVGGLVVGLGSGVWMTARETPTITE
jgi:hypothetical protein